MSHSHSHRFDPARLAKLDSPERRERMPPAAIVAALEVGRSARVADVGAGTGYVTFALLDAEPPPAIIDAIDVSEPMLAELTRRAAHHARGDRVIRHLARAEELPLPGGSVDRVVLGNMFHELDDAARALREARRVLVPEGRILILDWERPEGATGSAEIGPSYEHRVSSRDVEAALVAASFGDVRRHDGFRDVYAISARR